MKVNASQGFSIEHPFPGSDASSSEARPQQLTKSFRQLRLVVSRPFPQLLSAQHQSTEALPSTIDLNTPDFEGAAFRALEGIEFALDAFSLNTEQTQFELALWTSQ